MKNTKESMEMGLDTGPNKQGLDGFKSADPVPQGPVDRVSSEFKSLSTRTSTTNEVEAFPKKGNDGAMDGFGPSSDAPIEKF
jgi:hypothetical protein